MCFSLQYLGHIAFSVAEVIGPYFEAKNCNVTVSWFGKKQYDVTWGEENVKADIDKGVFFIKMLQG